MSELKKAFTGGIMNKDFDERLVAADQIRDALNIDIISTEGFDSGSARNKKGNTKINNLSDVTGLDTSTAKTIGAVAYESTNTIYFLVASDLFDGVYEYNEISGVTTRILQSNKATPTTPSLLNFDKEYYVTGFRFLDGFLFWTDGLNEPFGGLVQRWKSYTIDDDRIPLDTRVIKPAPLNSPLIEMKSEIGQENNMEDRFLQFCYRYKYIDNQFSAFSPFSSTAFVPGKFEIDYAAGNNDAMLNQQNRVSVRFETGNQFVTDIQVIFRDTRSLNTYITESFNKDEEGIADNYSHDFDFDNNKTPITLPSSQLSRMFDNVPLKAEAMEVIDRRLIYGNYTQFYDVVDTDLEPINIDLAVSYESEQVSGNNGTQTFRSDRDLEVAIQYGDGDSRFTTGLTSGNSTTYIKPENSITANSLVIDIHNTPPDFASEYRLLIKQRKNSYYNIFPILYRSFGVYRFFLINKSDRDKFEVGKYVIFKSDGSGPTLSNKSYKILEFEQKPDGFLGGSEKTGLYFKIKVEGTLFSPNNISDYNSTGIGGNSTDFNFCNQLARLPIVGGSGFLCADNPIFYGTSNAGSALTVANSWAYYGDSDTRIHLEITPNSNFKFKYIGNNNVTSATNGQWYYSNGPIIANTQIPIYGLVNNSTMGTVLNIEFSQDSGFDVGDSWRINCRGDSNNINSESVYGDKLRLLAISGTSSFPDKQHGGFSIIPGENWSETVIETDRQIQAGAVIDINIVEDRYNPAAQYGNQQFISSRLYENIEEWFYEDGIYNNFHQYNQQGVDIYGESVIFRRGRDWSKGVSGNSVESINEINQGYAATQETMSYPVHMIIRGYGQNDNCNQNIIKVDFSISQLDNPLICETDPVINDADIFHEMTDTYPIVNGLHTVLWAYEDFTDPQNGSGYTRIGQADPSGPIGTQRAHKFQVGDTINVTSPTTFPNINGVYTVQTGTDAYNVIIDFPWPGSGAVTPGRAGLTHGSGTLQVDQTNTVPATVVINHPQNPNATYNGYTFGNGLESNRIRDDFNETMLEYSPRATTIIDDYRNEKKDASLSYSGVYNGESSVNKLNEFNLAQVNYKNLDREFGSIQKLFARDTNLIVMQEDKITQVLYGKNLLSDSIGGGSITATPEVLGTQMAFAGEWGISSNPESFAKWGNNIFFTDQRRGAVLKLTSSGIFPISENGMRSYFRDLMKDNPNTQKLGVYDPHSNHYILSSNEDTSVPCTLSIDKTKGTYPSRNDDGLGTVNDGRPDFTILSSTSWTCYISYSSGSGWVTISGGNFPISGYGDQDIFLGIADNNTGNKRKAIIKISYCSGETKTFTITQGSGKRVLVTAWVSNNVVQ